MLCIGFVFVCMLLYTYVCTHAATATPTDGPTESRGNDQ